MKRGACASCGARIRWAKTGAGKAMPLDEMPVADGNVVVRKTIDGQVAVVLGRTEEPDPLEARFKSHFATCPNAERHRRAR